MRRDGSGVKKDGRHATTALPPSGPAPSCTVSSCTGRSDARVATLPDGNLPGRIRDFSGVDAVDGPSSSHPRLGGRIMIWRVRRRSTFGRSAGSADSRYSSVWRCSGSSIAGGAALRRHPDDVAGDGAPVFAVGLLEDLTKRVAPWLRLLAAAGSALLAVVYLGTAITRTDIWGLDWVGLVLGRRRRLVGLLPSRASPTPSTSSMDSTAWRRCA